MSFLLQRNGIWYIELNNGKRRSLGTRDEKKARRIKAELDRQLGAGTTPTQMTLTMLGDMAGRWGATYRHQDTVYRWNLAVRRWVENLGDVKVTDISRQDLQAFVDARLKPDKHGRSVSARTVNDDMGALCAIVNRAHQEGWYIGPNPFDGFEALPTRITRPTWLTREDARKLLDAARADRNMFLAVLMLLHVGMRKGEASEARWEWFDFEARRVHIPAIKKRKDRITPLRQLVIDGMEEHRPPDGKGFVLISGRQGTGKARYRYDFKKVFVALCKASGVDATPQKLRRTFVSHAVQKGAPLLEVADWIGHEDIRTLQRHYAGLAPGSGNIEKY